MFIGKNTLSVNEGTMKIIIQEWLDRNMPTNTPHVEGVKYADYRFLVTTNGCDNTQDAERNS